MAGPFRQLVFSGGGLRCIWQGGFMEVVREPLEIDPERVSGVSGGALSATGFIARKGRDVLDRFVAATSAEDDNVTLDDLDDEDGRTPHQRVYSDVVGGLIDEDVRNRIKDGPAYQILIAHPPSETAPGLTGAAMTAVYEAELHTVNSPHFSWTERFGLTSTLIDAREAAHNGRLAELVTAAATIPPLFRPAKWDGKPVIDGGMADQAPMPSPDEGRTMILLTRQYRRLPDNPDRLYVAPSKEMPADKIDFTDPEKLTSAWDVGRKDGEEFLRNWNTLKEERQWDV